MKIITSSNAPAPVGPYSQAIEINGFLYLSGQLAINPLTNTIDSSGIVSQTNQVLDNLNAVLSEAGYSKENVIKAEVFLTDIGDFGEFNKVYGEFFGDHKPVRQTVQVGLPLNAIIEISLIASKN
jgi:2-iminobutanoate/2-iminopropanoate deaminase